MHTFLSSSVCSSLAQAEVYLVILCSLAWISCELQRQMLPTTSSTFNVFGLLDKYSKVSLSLVSSEANQLSKLSHDCYDFLQTSAVTMINENKHIPMLCSYSADGTPIKTTVRTRVLWEVATPPGLATKHLSILFKLPFTGPVAWMGTCKQRLSSMGLSHLSMTSLHRQCLLVQSSFGQV